MDNALIIANSTYLDLIAIAKLAVDKTVVALDGAYNSLYKTPIPVDYILGDLDSISTTALNVAKERQTSIVTLNDQSMTDLEKAILYLDELCVSAITIVGATGGRLDHSLCNLQLLTRYHQTNRPIQLLTKHEVAWVVRDARLSIDGTVDDGFAIFGSPECVVTSHGLAYDMKNMALGYGQQNSVSNHFRKSTVSLSLTGTGLLLHQAQNKHDHQTLSHPTPKNE